MDRRATSGSPAAAASCFKKREKRRNITQGAFACLSNAWLPGWLSGGTYSGAGKYFCVPGLSCYSCPGALGACPLGAFQAVIGSRQFQFSFYIIGWLSLIGAAAGRYVCGWICPFGLVQDLLNKIPVIKKMRALPGEKWLRRLRWVVLAGLVCLAPLFLLDPIGQGQPAFCKWLCPSGALMAGWPLALLNQAVRQALGWLFAWKSGLLIALLGLAIFLYRPFCRYLCPLGLIYGFFNRYALLRHVHAPEECRACDACQAACPLSIAVRQKPNSPDCIRCGRCLTACPTNALKLIRPGAQTVPRRRPTD